MKRARFISFGLIFVFVGIAYAAEISNWNDDNTDHWQGWAYTPTGGGDWLWDSESGDANDGYVYFNDTSGQISSPALMAPWRYHGDYRQYGSSARFEMDVRVITSVPPVAGPAVALLGPGGVALYRLDTPTTAWQHYVVPLNGVGWNVTSGAWADLIADVNQVKLGGDIVNGIYAEAAYDNFTLIPEPASMILILCGASAVLLRRRHKR